MELITAIQELPKEDQLPVALDTIRDLLGGGSAEIEWWKQKFGVSASMAKIFATLHAAQGRAVPKTPLAQALWELPSTNESEMKIVDVHICKLRKALADQGFPKAIRTHWGYGYSLEEDFGEVEIPTGLSRALPNIPLQLKNHKLPWSPQDDEDLMRMVRRGDSWHVIAYEMERTERACVDRVHRLRRG